MPFHVTYYFFIIEEVSCECYYCDHTTPALLLKIYCFIFQNICHDCVWACSVQYYYRRFLIRMASFVLMFSNLLLVLLYIYYKTLL